MALYQPGDVVTLSGDKIIYAVWEDGEDDELPVPNTAAVTPNTGGNTTNNVGGGDILTYALPVSCVVLAGGIFITKRNKSHRKFD